MINAKWQNKEELPEEWKGSIIKKKVTSILNPRYQWLDWVAGVSCQWDHVSSQKRATWSPVQRPEPITRRLLHLGPTPMSLQWTPGNKGLWRHKRMVKHKSISAEEHDMQTFREPWLCRPIFFHGDFSASHSAFRHFSWESNYCIHDSSTVKIHLRNAFL